MIPDLPLFQYNRVEIPRPCPKDMPEACADVLRKLQENGMRGITWDDFARGFALRSRISDLRKQGYSITTKGERLSNGSVRARYILLEEPHNQQ